MSSNESTPVLRVRGVTKHYGHVQALRGVDLDIRPGEIVGLVGDNGAGKSTLIGILSGAVAPSSGSVEFLGEPVELASPVEARRLGIETVYQDLALAPDLPIWSNLFLGREQVTTGLLGKLFGWLDRDAMVAEAEQQLTATKIRIGATTTRAGALSGGQRQAIAVARAVSWGSHLVLMDEPTAALGVEQQQRVGELIQNVASTGLPVLLISHNLPQVQEICDRVLVLFGGRIVADLDPKQHGVEEIIRWITGAAVVEQQAPDAAKQQATDRERADVQ
ncbi:ATP-binding cassette domain-containing protein [Plantibacter flavus]|uniref:ATP-binding cassette domain-containing protein n=1 Tax=Plantibacter flavus TaxID=150123 RepID=UPI003F5CEFEC